ncbi:MAG TPA: response regulator [Bryobacteraceae bacterium]|jgi:two-component system cell cycle sensor histidine kinase/response regulator CckA
MKLVRTALVVDDEPPIRAFIRVILEREGFRTLEAEGGRDAWTAVELLGGRLDVLITDIQMPDGDGLTLARAVTRAYPSIPIILVSGRVKPDDDFEFVEKPFSWATLADAIHRLTDAREKIA